MTKPVEKTIPFWTPVQLQEKQTYKENCVRLRFAEKWIHPFATSMYEIREKRLSGKVSTISLVKKKKKDDSCKHYFTTALKVARAVLLFPLLIALKLAYRHVNTFVLKEIQYNPKPQKKAKPLPPPPKTDSFAPEKFPTDLLKTVGSFFEAEDLAKLGAVNKRFDKVLGKSAKESQEAFWKAVGLLDNLSEKPFNFTYVAEVQKGILKKRDGYGNHTYSESVEKPIKKSINPEILISIKETIGKIRPIDRKQAFFYREGMMGYTMNLQSLVKYCIADKAAKKEILSLLEAPNCSDYAEAQPEQQALRTKRTDSLE